MRPLAIGLLLLCAGILPAVQYSGSVRAADQFIPGATVTARNGGAKVVAYTNEAGRYVLDLTPRVWEIEIEMFRFATRQPTVPFRYQSPPPNYTLYTPPPAAKSVPHPPPPP